MHENRAHPRKTAGGISFLGYRVFPDYILLKKPNVRRFSARMKRYAGQYRREAVRLKAFRQSLMSWIGYAAFADSFRLRRILFYKMRTVSYTHLTLPTIYSV